VIYYEAALEKEKENLNKRNDATAKDGDGTTEKRMERQKEQRAYRPRHDQQVSIQRRERRSSTVIVMSLHRIRKIANYEKH
jgi:hypothetical protein